MRSRGDVSLNATRIGQLLDLFGGIERVHTLGARGRGGRAARLDQVSDLPVQCETARVQGLRVTAIQRAQAQARQAAGRILSDTESYLADVRLAEALINGLAQPTVKLVAVTCLARGDVMVASHAQ